MSPQGRRQPSSSVLPGPQPGQRPLLGSPLRGDRDNRGCLGRRRDREDLANVAPESCLGGAGDNHGRPSSVCVPTATTGPRGPRRTLLSAASEATRPPAHFRASSKATALGAARPVTDTQQRTTQGRLQICAVPTQRGPRGCRAEAGPQPQGGGNKGRAVAWGSQGACDPRSLGPCLDLRPTPPLPEADPSWVPSDPRQGPHPWKHAIHLRTRPEGPQRASGRWLAAEERGRRGGLTQVVCHLVGVPQVLHAEADDVHEVLHQPEQLLGIGAHLGEGEAGVREPRRRRAAAPSRRGPPEPRDVAKDPCAQQGHSLCLLGPPSPTSSAPSLSGSCHHAPHAGPWTDSKQMGPESSSPFGDENPDPRGAAVLRPRGRGPTGGEQWSLGTVGHTGSRPGHGRSGRLRGGLGGGASDRAPR